MEDSATGNLIVYNGEIYNHLDVRRRMPCEQFRSSSDTETLLVAYRRYGMAMLDQLVGMFAFGLWDENLQQLILVRDRLGIKPLYYSNQGGDFVFASQIRALLAGRFVRPEVDEDGLDSYLAFGAVQEPYSILKNVIPLAPGEVIRVGADGQAIHKHRFWSLSKFFHTKRDSSVGAIRELVSTAVSDRLISDVPVGAFLSGGIDSSVIVAAMAERSTTAPITFCLDFAEGRYREGRYAEVVAKRHRTNHSTIVVTPGDLLDRLDDAMQAMDQPTVDGINSYFVSGVARASGVTVALSGQGGDEIFAGYPSFRFLPRILALSGLPAWTLKIIKCCVRSVPRNSQRFNKIADTLNSGSLDLYEAYAHQRGIFWDRIRDTIRPDSRCSMRSRDWISNAVSPQSLSNDPINAVSQLELSCYLRNTLLRDLDAFSMAHSLEVRVPLLDHRLVEHMAGVPGRTKIGNGVNKRLLVQAFDDLLPAEIVRRPKGIFWFPWNEWLRGRLLVSLKESLLSSKGDLLTQYGISSQATSRLLSRFVLKRQDVSWQQVWALHVLATWLARNIHVCCPR